MQDHALDRGRLHPLDGLPRPPRRAVLGDAAGAAGARRGRLRRDPGRDRRRRPERGRDRRAWPTPRWCCSRPGMGDGIQAAKAGHPRDRRRLRRQQGRPRRRRPGAPRPALDARRWPSGPRAPGARRSSRPSPAPARASTRWSTAIDEHPRHLARDRRARAPARCAGAPRRDRGDRGDRAARALAATCTGTPSWTTWPSEVVAGRDRPVRRRRRRCWRAYTDWQPTAVTERTSRARLPTTGRRDLVETLTDVSCAAHPARRSGTRTEHR